MPHLFVHGLGVYTREHWSVWTARDARHLVSGARAQYGLDHPRGLLRAYGFQMGHFGGMCFPLGSRVGELTRCKGRSGFELGYVLLE
jgi:hypothetical protein